MGAQLKSKFEKSKVIYRKDTKVRKLNKEYTKTCDWRKAIMYIFRIYCNPITLSWSKIEKNTVAVSMIYNKNNIQTV